MELTTELKELLENYAHHVSYSETEAAARLGFKDVNTLRNLRKKGKITFSSICGRARYTPGHLDDFLKKHEIKARS